MNVCLLILGFENTQLKHMSTNECLILGFENTQLKLMSTNECLSTNTRIFETAQLKLMSTNEVCQAVLCELLK